MERAGGEPLVTEVPGALESGRGLEAFPPASRVLRSSKLRHHRNCSVPKILVYMSDREKREWSGHRLSGLAGGVVGSFDAAKGVERPPHRRFRVRCS